MPSYEGTATFFGSATQHRRPRPLLLQVRGTHSLPRRRRRPPSTGPPGPDSKRDSKFRTSFRLPNLHLDLDETPLGAFLELEGAAKAIDRVSRALGYSTHDYLRSSYWDVYAAACRRLGRLPRNMVFERNKIAK